MGSRKSGCGSDSEKSTRTKTADKTAVCALCERLVQNFNKHHLIPRSEGGREYVVVLCITCHKMLQSSFSNHRLATDMNSIENLRQDPNIQLYLRWIRKRPESILKVHPRRDRS